MSLTRRVRLADGLRYQGKGPMLTYILHRIGGLGIVLFVGLHILASFLANQAWGSSIGIFINTIYENWIFQIFIFFCALFHVINGLRIVILDLWPKLIEFQREAIWVEWLIFLPIYAISVIVIVRGALGI
jgi:succinate dehydrogenase / fumarate reductase cytochrome b subunit